MARTQKIDLDRSSDRLEYSAGQINWRQGVLVILFALGISAITFRLYELQIVQHQTLSAQAKSAQLGLIMVPAERGVIVDTHGFPLALSVESWDLYLDQIHWEENPTAAKYSAADLAHYLGTDIQKEHGIPKNQIQEWLIQWAHDPRTSNSPVLKTLTLGQRSLIETKSLFGIRLLPRSQRIYPNKTLNSQVLGYVNSFGEALWGIEHDYNRSLQGESGWALEEKNALGGTLGYTPSIGKKTIPGKDIRLTIDSEIQRLSQEHLVAGLEEYQALAGQIIVVDLTKNSEGAIRAIAIAPELNYQDINPQTGPPSIDKTINSVIAHTYEPGSIFKPLTVAMALDQGVITTDTLYKDTGVLCFNSQCTGNSKIQNWEGQTYGEVNAQEILKESINTGAAWIGSQLTPKDFYHYLDLYNIGHKTGIDLRGEVSGGLITPENSSWQRISQATQSYGHGVSVTPIQAIMALTTFYTNGCLIEPFVLESADQLKPLCERGHRVISASTAKTMQRLMQGVVENKSWHQAKVTGYSVAGKTGTAIRYDKLTGTYAEDKMDATFVGFIPAEKPRLAILIRLIEPQKNNSLAGSTAAPMFSKLATELMAYLRVPAEETNQITRK
jgi:cell division protein FtsI (penicillin-binding protein 3)